MTLREIRRQLKTARGQLLLFGATFCGAIVMAIGALCLKPVLFEPYIRHRLPPLSAPMREFADRVTLETSSDDDFRTLREADVNSLYGGLINGEVEDPDNYIIDGLIQFRPGVVLDRLRITVATGSSNQKLRALRLLERSRAEDRVQAVRLSQVLVDRAIRTGDLQIQQTAESVLYSLNSVDGDNNE